MSLLTCVHIIVVVCVTDRVDINYRELKENSSRRTLNDFLKAECSGDYLKFLKYVCRTRPKFLADQLGKAMDGNRNID